MTRSLNNLPWWAVLPVLALACYRLQRLVTTDSWLPFQQWRMYLNKKAQPATKSGRHNIWTEAAELFSCPHCLGLWTTVAVFCEHYLLHSIPMLVYAIFAAAGLVSILAEQESD